MKIKLYKSLLLGVLFLNLLSVSAQGTLKQPIPFEKEVRTGQLKNGMTYFIKRNTKPESRVELRLVVNAGSVLEDKDQLGLAHFTEHMAFNGSKNFAKNDLVSYLQSVGVKFGAHLNAYTSFDQTVYILPIPSDNDTIVEKGLTILEDWAGNLTFDPTELNKERGVVIEEWRLGQGAQMRMLEKYFPVILKGSKYAERLPIGTKEVLESFDVATIKRFYADWYRPDLMAVIAVGDINVDQMEAKIKAHFSGFKNPKKPRVRENFDLPDNDAPLAAVTSDPEATNILFNIMYKRDAKVQVTEKDFRDGLVQSLFTNLINQRLSELTQTANPPYIYATTYMGSPISRKKTAFSGFSVAKPDDIKTGVVTLLEEIRRVSLHGFNASELKTAKLKMLEMYQNAYNERDKTNSGQKADELIRHFLDKEPVPGIAYEFEFAQKHLEGISLAEINGVIAEVIPQKNRIVYLTAPEKEGIVLPTAEELLAWVAESEKSQLDPIVEEVVDVNLLKVVPVPGQIAETKRIENIDVDEIVLSNGARIFLKKTDFKNDEIQFSAYRSGGTSVAEDADYWSASMADNIVSLSGIGDYTYVNLEKALAGKSVGVSPYISELESGFSGSASPKDLETLLQLVYLYFTEVRRDEDAFQSLLSRNEAILAHVLSNPNYFYQDKLSRIMGQNHLRGGGIPTIEDLKKADLDKAISFFKQQFSSPGDFTFWFVGNFDKAVLLPLVQQYLGSIPAKNKDLQWKDRGVRPPSGRVDEKVIKGTDPKSMVTINFTGEMKYSREENYYIKSLAEVLSIKLIEILREEKGGVYGVGASGSAQQSPYESYSLTIKFPCGPENVDSLVNAAIGVVNQIKTNGVTKEDLVKIKETQRREMQINWKENGFWTNILKAYYKNEYDYKDMILLDKRIETLSSADIQNVAKKYLNTDAYIKVVLYPETTTKE